MSFDTPLPPYNATDPHASFLNSSCLDLLLIELVPMAHRLAREVVLSADDGREGEGGEPETKEGRVEFESEEERDAVFYRLDGLGYRVGQGLVERFTRERPRFTDTLDVIKFLCKDLWTLVFRKQIDNLKTNHRGIYVLTDNTFRPFSRMSTEAGGGAVGRAQPFLFFPCGVIRGALAALGIAASVHAETAELPGATFQIKTAGAKV
ncbi:MAG: Trafficking protein particle complex subunit 33 [Thelocarpon impressellum]|nr:MAG: Trafficking protein particle complex subunit 33 [Thelocarpon impressellum]